VRSVRTTTKFNLSELFIDAIGTTILLTGLAVPSLLICKNSLHHVSCVCVVMAGRLVPSATPTSSVSPETPINPGHYIQHPIVSGMLSQEEFGLYKNVCSCEANREPAQSGCVSTRTGEKLFRVLNRCSRNEDSRPTLMTHKFVGEAKKVRQIR
jgi:hypothetical protein